MYWLKIIGGPTRGESYPLRDGVYSIGRDASAHIQLDAPMVSRLHSTIKVHGENVEIIDHGSANGTIVNGAKIAKTNLRNGDKIYIGDFVLEYSVTDVKPDIFDVDTSAKQRRPDILDQQINKLSAISHQMTWSSKILVILALTIILGGLLLLYLANSKIEGDLEAIALSKGKTIVKYLAEKNKSDLKSGNEMLLDVKSAMKEKGVLDAVITDAKGSVIAPVEKQNTLEKNPYLLEALNIEKSEVVSSSRLSHNLYIMAYPIRVYDSDRARYETIGAARIVFSPEELISTLPSGGQAPYLFIILLVATGALAYVMIKRVTLTPVKSLTDKTEQAKIDGNFEPDVYPAEFNELASSIQRLAAVIQLLKSEEQSVQVAAPPETPSIISSEKIDTILSIIPEPAIVFDNERIILSINDQAVMFFNLESTTPIGKKTREIIEDKSINDTVEDTIEEAESSHDKVTSKTIEVGLKTYQISVTGIKDHTGRIEFGILIIETI